VDTAARPVLTSDARVFPAQGQSVSDSESAPENQDICGPYPAQREHNSADSQTGSFVIDSPPALRIDVFEVIEYLL